MSKIINEIDGIRSIIVFCKIKKFNYKLEENNLYIKTNPNIFNNGEIIKVTFKNNLIEIYSKRKIKKS